MTEENNIVDEEDVLSEEFIRREYGKEEFYRDEVRGMIQDEMAALEPLFEERRAIQEKIEMLQQRAEDYDADIQNHVEKQEQMEQEGLEQVLNGKKPNLSKKAHDNEVALEDMKRWRSKIDGQIKQAHAELEQLEKKIGHKCTTVLRGLQPVFQEIMAKLFLRAEALRDAWYKEISESYKENNIFVPVFADRPHLKFPFSKKINAKMMGFPHSAVNIIRERMLKEEETMKELGEW